MGNILINLDPKRSLAYQSDHRGLESAEGVSLLLFLLPGSASSLSKQRRRGTKTPFTKEKT
jgi:hypothetical protein